MTKSNRRHNRRISGFSAARTARRAATLVWCAGAAVAGLNFAEVAWATDISWTGAAGTPLSFGTGTNWVGGSVPDTLDNAFINNGGIATVATGFTRTVTTLRLGNELASSGTLTQTGGTINATGNMAFGAGAGVGTLIMPGGAGTLNISGGALHIGSGIQGDFSIGDNGAGTATISGSGVITTRFAFLGRSTHGHGHVTQTGGGLIVQRNLVMAELKPADLLATQTPSDYTMSAGSITVGEEMYIGAHGPVTFNLSGTGTISVVGTLHIGASGGQSDAPAGVGTLNMSGGTINITGANGYFVVADHGNATFNFSGGSVIAKLYRVGENFELGFPTVGIVNHTGGTVTAEYDWVIGNESRSANLYDLSGGSVTVIGIPSDPFNPGNVSIGSGPGGRGTLMVRGTGVARVANSAVIGGATFSSGTLIVSSGGSLALGTNGLGSAQMTVGSNGTGNFQISGGIVSTDLITLGQNTSAVGTGTQTGGTVVVRSNISIGETSLANNVYDITAGTMSVGGGIYLGSTGNGTLKVGGTATVTSALTIENAPTGGGTIEVSGGNLTGPSMNNRGLYTQSGGHASLGDVTGPGQLSVSGGSLAVTSIAQGTVGISSTGSVTVAPNGTNAGLSVVNSLSITGGGKLDLANNDMVVEYTGPSVAPTVRTYLASGRNSGLWNGPGINSSKAATSPNAGEQGETALGYGESGVILGASGGTFDGQIVDNTAVLVKYTYAGDSDLDGDVDVADLGNLASNWQTAAVWTGGDFDYTGSVDVNDLGLLATNWQAGVASPLGPGSLPAALASLGLPALSVPEPTALALLSCTLPLLGRRRSLNRALKRP